MENGWDSQNQDTDIDMDDDIRQKLINRFVENNKDKFDEIMNGIETGDIKLAYRLAHTLKSNAGQLKLTALQKAAETIEHQLKNGVNAVAPEQAEALKTELDAAFLKLVPLVREPVVPVGAKPLGREETLALLEKTEAALREYDTECMTFIDGLRMVPGSEALIRQMEDFDFDKALTTILELKAKI